MVEIIVRSRNSASDGFKGDLSLANILESNMAFNIDSISNTNVSKDGFSLGLYFAKGNDYPTFIDGNLDEEKRIYGTVFVDIQRKKILYEPFCGTGKWREQIQAYHGLQLNYSGGLIDVINELTSADYDIFQITSLDNPIFVGENFDMKKYNQIVQVQEMFENLSGKNKQDAFRVEGNISIDDILHSNLISIKSYLGDKNDLVLRVKNYFK